MSDIAPGLHPTKWLTDGWNASQRAIVSAKNKRERFEKSLADAVKGLAESDLELAEAMTAKFELEMALAVFEVDPNAPPPVCPETVEALTDAGVVVATVEATDDDEAEEIADQIGGA